jgi:hypothetical protein
MSCGHNSSLPPPSTDMAMSAAQNEQSVQTGQAPGSEPSERPADSSVSVLMGPQVHPDWLDYHDSLGEPVSVQQLELKEAREQAAKRPSRSPSKPTDGRIDSTNATTDNVHRSRTPPKERSGKRPRGAYQGFGPSRGSESITRAPASSSTRKHGTKAVRCRKSFFKAQRCGTWNGF